MCSVRRWSWPDARRRKYSSDVDSGATDGQECDAASDRSLWRWCALAEREDQQIQLHPRGQSVPCSPLLFSHVTSFSVSQSVCMHFLVSCAWTKQLNLTMYSVQTKDTCLNSYAGQCWGMERSAIGKHSTWDYSSPNCFKNQLMTFLLNLFCLILTVNIFSCSFYRFLIKKRFALDVANQCNARSFVLVVWTQ